MRSRGLYALLLAAFLTWIALPLLHQHEERGHGGEGRDAAHAHVSDCVVCELLAVAPHGLEPTQPLKIDAVRPVAGAAASFAAPAPCAVHFSLTGAPRGPPASPLA